MYVEFSQKDSMHLFTLRSLKIPTILLPNIPAIILRDLVTICTTETPFVLNSNHYIQCESVYGIYARPNNRRLLHVTH